MNRRKSSIAMEGVVTNINITRLQQLELQTLFKKTPPVNGVITFYDLIVILKNLFTITEEERNRLLKEMQSKEIKNIDASAMIWAASALRKIKEEEDGEVKKEENEYYDAFVALGGNTDKSGYVYRNTLVNIVNEEFGISIDNDIDGLHGLDQDKLNYDDFCDLFKGKQLDYPQDQNTPPVSRQRSQSMKTVKINIEDFNDYLTRLEQNN